jgi:hypothetical protein
VCLFVCLFFVCLIRASLRFALAVALRRLNAFAGLLLVMALFFFVSVCFAFCFAPLCLVVCFFDFDLHIALLRFDSHVVAIHCCAVLCLACYVFAFALHCPPKRTNDPTAQGPEGRPAGTAQQANHPTGQRAERRFHPFN